MVYTIGLLTDSLLVRALILVTWNLPYYHDPGRTWARTMVRCKFECIEFLFPPVVLVPKPISWYPHEQWFTQFTLLVYFLSWETSFFQEEHNSQAMQVQAINFSFHQVPITTKWKGQHVMKSSSTHDQRLDLNSWPLELNKPVILSIAQSTVISQFILKQTWHGNNAQ